LSVTNFVYTFTYRGISCGIEVSKSMNSLISFSACTISGLKHADQKHSECQWHREGDPREVQSTQTLGLGPTVGAVDKLHDF